LTLEKVSTEIIWISISQNISDGKFYGREIFFAGSGDGKPGATGPGGQGAVWHLMAATA
jgi:hypothetical protein